jgi:hypothetical protein
MRKNLLFVAVLALGALNIVKAQTVYFNGLGRAIVTNDRLKGLALDPATPGSKPDTANNRKGTGGYTLLDLGVNAQPNESLRASAILRVRNEFGGFYGDGSRLEFRQLRLDGVLNKVVKYEIGDIDLSLTPYTLYNFDEMYHDYESDLFAIRRSIVNYENFNFGNNWRLQGAHASSAIKFNKVIEKIGINGFATRTRRTNFVDLPDRILVGGDVDLVQSKFLTLGFNVVQLKDITKSVPSTITNFNNTVWSGDLKLQFELAEKIGLGVNGEFGQSSFSYDSAKVKVKSLGSFKDNGFSDFGAFVKYIPFNLKAYGSYRYVAPLFSSPGAQTRRIYDMGTAQLFPTIGNNEVVARTPILFDRITDESLRNLAIQTRLMTFLPEFNNITPYGLATPNRKGITVGVSAGGAEKAFSADVIFDKLNEISGEGVTSATGENTRSFTGIKAGASIAINKLIKFEKGLSINFGYRSEKTERTVNPVDFKSTLIDAGLTVEVVKQLDLMGGFKQLSASGNEFLAVRNPYNEITGYRTYDIDTKQNIAAFGLRYRFSRNNFFTAQGHWVNFTNNRSKFDNYKINQVFLSYTMVF